MWKYFVFIFFMSVDLSQSWTVKSMFTLRAVCKVRSRKAAWFNSCAKQIIPFLPYPSSAEPLMSLCLNLHGCDHLRRGFALMMIFSFGQNKSAEVTPVTTTVPELTLWFFNQWIISFVHNQHAIKDECRSVTLFAAHIRTHNNEIQADWHLRHNFW